MCAIALMRVIVTLAPICTLALPVGSYPQATSLPTSRPSRAYQRAIDLLDLHRPAEAEVLLRGVDDPYALALRAALLGNERYRRLGLRAIDRAQADQLAKSVLSFLERRAAFQPEAAYLLAEIGLSSRLDTEQVHFAGQPWRLPVRRAPSARTVV